MTSDQAGGRIPVYIPETLYRRIEALVEKLDGVDSVDEYVTRVLREFVQTHEEDLAEPFSEEEKREILERLKRLGYL